MRSSPPLVSIIIPCYNAANWVSEAVDSCLAQTYSPIEIIVIDDGSTDSSVEVLQTYGEQIVLQVAPENRNGSHARNHGVALANGTYIQFLDADDYLLPDKIARQVSFLQESGADVVYGDWQHQYHEAGVIRMGTVTVSEHQEDVLTSLLRGWWTANHSILFRRETVIASGGWDETITVADDRDFFISVAMRGADIRYQSGCHTIYRRYGAITLSTSNQLGAQRGNERLLNKAWNQLEENGRLTTAHKEALAISYFNIARNYYQKENRAKRDQIYNMVLSLNPHFRPQESRLYTTTYRLFGFEAAEWLAHRLRKLRGRDG